jgi:hypothetical protein
VAVVAEKHIIIQSSYKIGACLISRHRLVKPLHTTFKLIWKCTLPYSCRDAHKYQSFNVYD